MSEPELEWLAGQALTHHCIVEIGSYLGRSTRALADNTPGVVYAIDDWYGPRDTTWLTDEYRGKLYDTFISNMAGLEDKVIPIKINHKAVVILDEAPDMVFIDGDHTYENVKRDIDRWLPRVIPTGLICGHDADKPGVRRAVVETFGGVQTAPDTNIWYVEV